MKILTGCNGFIGKKFADQMDAKFIGFEMGNCFQLLDNLPVWDQVDEIIHMGAISSTTETDIGKITIYNTEFSIRLFKKAIELGIPVKYASSASVYGNSAGNMNPLNYYAISKVQVDYWVQDNIDQFKKIQGFRFFNVYGEGEEHKGNQRSPISKFVSEAKMTGKIKIFKHSEKMVRDFVYVGDVVDLVLNNDQPSGIYDIGTGHPHSFRDIADIIAEKYNAKIEEIDFPEHLQGKYQFYTCADMLWNNGYNYTNVEDYINLPEPPDKSLLQSVR
jgi:ADP-L-glycero-D-manno-heptose 6-epimerase|tara:strand:+ start:1201 stop:2025 length:825 start_codon:yes stop_codon:yes gene_type:complete